MNSVYYTITLLVIFNVIEWKARSIHNISHFRSNSDRSLVMNNELMQSMFAGKGIVMCASEKMMPNIIRSLWQLRYLWNTSLPISIAHCGELSKGSQVKILDVGPLIDIIDVCVYDQIKPATWRMRGFFCKVAALIVSPYKETMLLDHDVVWFNYPQLLFTAPTYLSTGALYFRDRTYPDPKPNAHIIDFLNSNNVSMSNTSLLQSISDSCGINLLFHSLVERASGKTVSFNHQIQESSVVVFDKSMHPKTLELLTNFLPDYALGYGDKEMFWITTTIAGEPFSFEPYLAGQMGDCHGIIVHYDPFAKDQDNATPFYANGEYFVEEAEVVGEWLHNQNQVITPPMLVKNSFDKIHENMNTWTADGKRARSGCTCKTYECQKIPTEVVNYMLLQQWAFIAIHNNIKERGMAACVPIFTTYAENIQYAFKDSINKKTCELIGCPALPLTINHSLPWPTDARYCEPIIYEYNPSDETLNALQLRVAEARRPDSSFNRPTFLIENALLQAHGSRAVYVYLNDSIHLIPSMDVFVRLGRDTSEIVHIHPWQLHNLHVGNEMSI